MKNAPIRNFETIHLSTHGSLVSVRVLPPSRVVFFLRMVVPLMCSLRVARMFCRLHVAPSVCIPSVCLAMRVAVYTASNIVIEAVDMARSPVLANLETIPTKTITYVCVVENTLQAHRTYLLISVTWQNRSWYSRNRVPKHGFCRIGRWRCHCRRHVGGG